jgi:hypothetical protein
MLVLSVDDVSLCCAWRRAFCSIATRVMAGPVPAIHALSRGNGRVDCRDEPGNDE